MKVQENVYHLAKSLAKSLDKIVMEQDGSIFLAQNSWEWKNVKIVADKINDLIIPKSGSVSLYYKGHNDRLLQTIKYLRDFLCISDIKTIKNMLENPPFFLKSYFDMVELEKDEEDFAEIGILTERQEEKTS